MQRVQTLLSTLQRRGLALTDAPDRSEKWVKVALASSELQANLKVVVVCIFTQVLLETVQTSKPGMSKYEWNWDSIFWFNDEHSLD